MIDFPDTDEDLVRLIEDLLADGREVLVTSRSIQIPTARMDRLRLLPNHVYRIVVVRHDNGIVRFVLQDPFGQSHPLPVTALDLRACMEPVVSALPAG